jgi:hypothetical protein
MIKSCFINFDKYKGDPKAICNRISIAPLQNKGGYHLKYRKEKENIEKDRVNIKLIFKNFYQNDFSFYQGDLYDRINTLYGCLNILINDYQKEDYLDDFKKFYHYWNHFINTGELIFKCQLLHTINKFFKKIYKFHRYYLDTSFLKLIEQFHQENIRNDTYRKLRRYYYQNKLRYKSPTMYSYLNRSDNTIKDSKTEEVNNTTINNDEWDSVSIKKNKKHNKSDKSSATKSDTTNQHLNHKSIHMEEPNEVLLTNETDYNLKEMNEEELEMILDLDNNENDYNDSNDSNNNINIFNNNINNILNINDEKILDELRMIEPNLDFVEFVDIEEYDEYDKNEYSSDDPYD